ncbi:ferredoxin-NADP reductase [Haliangium sp.]|uniref:ferredoxin-NADP reductase n=1 Tax=Haliangium sp. TaxID=2663208 RepID=UPI003D0F50B8
MRLQELDTSNRFTATVVSSQRITPEASQDEVRELVLDVGAALDLDVGQSVGVLAPGQKEFGQDHHLRLYSVADLPEKTDTGTPRIKICVKRCTYIDDYSGERYDGVASNYLCDRRAGDELTLTGPFGLPFEVPPEQDASLILIATSTGIAPFRAFVRHLYERTDFAGRIWLFYGARSGLDMAYLNEERDDFAQYYDKETFEAFKVLSPRPAWGDDIDWGSTIEERGEEIWKLLSEAKTYVYVAGLEQVRDALDGVFAKVAGNGELWERRRAEMVAGKRWVELLY